MGMNIDEQKNEIIKLFIIVISLAILVGLISDILFASFYLQNKLVFIISVSVLVVILSVISYFVVGKLNVTQIEISFPFTINLKTQKFIDICYCPPSVHARIHFDLLTPGIQKDFMCSISDEIGGSSEFQDYLDDVIQATILTLLLKQFSIKMDESCQISYENLPKTFKRNHCLRRASENNRLFDFFIPPDIRLHTYGHNERFIKFSSKFGEISIDWGISFCQIAHETGPYLTAINVDPKNDAKDFIIHPRMRFNYKLVHFKTREFEEYMFWVNQIQKQFKSFDWESSYDKIQLELLQILINEIREKKDK